LDWDYTPPCTFQVVNFNCVKVHQHEYGLEDIWTDGQGDSYIPPETLFEGVIITEKLKRDKTSS